MKRFKKELSWLLVTALVVSSLVIGLGQLSPKAATDAAGTSRIYAKIHVKANDGGCSPANDHRGTDSDFEVRFLNASGGTVAKISIIDGPEADTTTDWTSGQVTVNKTITKCQLIETRHSDEFCLDWIEYYYETTTGWVKVAEDRPGGDSDQFTAVGHERTVATTWFTSNVKTLTFDANGGSPTTTYDAIPNQTISAPGAPSRTGHTFTGWASVPARMPNAAATYYAGWTANSYSITFNGNGATGGVPGTITQAYGTAVTQPANPYRTGYTFTGWSPACPSTMGTGTACVAQWSVNSYSITFNGNGATGGVPATITQNYGTAVTQPADPTRTGYTFAGWSPACPSTMGTGTACVAQWNINQYSVSFDGNGGTTPTTITQNYGTSITVPSSSRTGYTFDGWSPACPTTMPASNTSCTAQWTINSYTITWNPNNGSAATTTSVNHGATPTPPTGITRTGWTFTGWSPTIVAATGATTYTAQWTQNDYTYTFDANGGTGGTSGSLHYGDSIPAAPTVTRTGYTFTAWSPTPAATMPDHDVTYTAGWTINQHTISFNSNGGSAVTAIQGNYNTTASAPTDPTKTGNTFAGWYSDAGLTNAVSWPYTITGDVTFYAKWTVNNYNITFDAAGGTGGTGPTAMAYGATLTAPVVAKTGYTFAGWDTTVPATVPAADTTYTAQWTINYYTVSFSTDGGSAVTPKTQNYGTSVTEPTAPTKTGNTFDGWYSDAGLTTAVTWPYTLGAADVTFYAKWTVNSYYITFDANGGTGGTGPTLMQYGATLTAPTVTKTGSTFSGWSTTVPATVPAADTTYTAQWDIDSYTISFDSAGGSAVTPITQEFGTSVTAPADPTKTGYTFTGWDPAVPNPMPAQDVECVAQWTINTYYVIFNANTGTGTMSNLGITYNTSANLTANTFANTGYTFAGWNTAADGSGTYYADAASYGPIGAADVTLYAQWTADQQDLELIPVVAEGITTVIVEPTVEEPIGYIYGLEQGLSAEDFEAYWVEIVGDGSLVITPYNEFGLFGTGTKIEFVDNADDSVVATYYIVIFGDVDGDGYITGTDGDVLYSVDSFDIEWDLELVPCLSLAGDLDGDGYITGTDGDFVYNIDSFDINMNQVTGQWYE